VFGVFWKITISHDGGLISSSACRGIETDLGRTRCGTNKYSRPVPPFLLRISRVFSFVIYVTGDGYATGAHHFLGRR
jgi:hypothetical protein